MKHRFADPDGVEMFPALCRNSLHPCESVFHLWLLTLPLLVPFVAANHPNDAFAPDDLAVLTQLFDGRANFHIKSFSFRAGCGLRTSRKATAAI